MSIRQNNNKQKQIEIMTNFILDRTNKNQTRFISNAFTLGGFTTPQVSDNVRDAIRFDSRDSAQAFINSLNSAYAKNLIII